MLVRVESRSLLRSTSQEKRNCHSLYNKLKSANGREFYQNYD